MRTSTIPFYLFVHRGKICLADGGACEVLHDLYFAL